MARTSRTQRGHRRPANPPGQRRSSSATHSSLFYGQPQGTGSSGPAHHHGSGDFTANGYNAGPSYSVSDCGSRLLASDYCGSDYGGGLLASNYNGRLSASDYGSGPPASDYYDTQSTHLQSVFTGENGTAQHSGYSPYTQDDNSSGYAFLPITHQPPPSITFGNDFLSEPNEPTDTAQPHTHHGANAAPDALLFTGAGFSDEGGSSHLGTNPPSFHQPTIPAAHLGLSGTDEQFPPLDSSEPFDLPGQLDDVLQLDPGSADFSGLPDHSLPNTAQIDPFQWHAIPNIPRIDAQDAAHDPPWSSQSLGSCPQRQSGALPQPPSQGDFSGLSPAAAAPPPSTAGSSQASQQEGSMPVIYCELCDTFYSSLKSYNRHLLTTIRHQEGEDHVFVCKCGMTATRKDNFQARHFENCKKPHGPSDVYTCCCYYKAATVRDLKQHFTDCPRQKKRGRPPGRTV